MQFIVPKIERKLRIGPLTLEQLVYLVVGGAISFLLYHSIPLTSFIIASSLVITLTLLMAFGKIGRDSFPVFIKKAFLFALSSKIYLWKRKEISVSFAPEKKSKLKEEKEEEGLKIAQYSRLKDLSTKLETKSK
ncbi:MAG: hypothetical protein PHI53_02490 [Candidatus Pacebacteria bacterium]|nr:hypothetical protein [Candidatus Paceibacterota bacterium]